MKYRLFFLLLPFAFCLLPSPAWAPPIRSQSCDAGGCTIVTTSGTFSFTVTTVGVTTTLTVFKNGVQQFQGSINNATCALLETNAGQQVQALLASEFNLAIHCFSVNPFSVTLASYDNGITLPPNWWGK